MLGRFFFFVTIREIYAILLMFGPCFLLSNIHADSKCVWLTDILVPSKKIIFVRIMNLRFVREDILDIRSIWLCYETDFKTANFLSHDSVNIELTHLPLYSHAEGSISCRDGNEDEVFHCVQDLYSPSFCPSMISIWVKDSFERKDKERDLLAGLLVNLTKSKGGVLTTSQLTKG